MRFKGAGLGAVATGALVAASVFAVGASAGAPGGTTGVLPPPRAAAVYSASFMCGDWDKTLAGEEQGLIGPVKPGDYATVINVHNPNFTTVAGLKKAVLLVYGTGPASGTTQPMEQPMPPGSLVKWSLQPDYGLEIDCPDIRSVLLSGNPNAAASFIEGWVVIEVRAGTPIDVDAIYTGHTFGPATTSTGVAPPVGFAIQTERISPTVVPLPLTPALQLP